MSTQHSRKNFFAKLLGLIAVAGAAPRLFAKSAVTSVAPTPAVVPFAVRNDIRTVARSGDSV